MKGVLLTSLLALVIGLGAGLGYAWVVAPHRYGDAAPSALRGDFKDRFRTLIAASYSATHNLDRARARLKLLGDEEPVEALTGQAQRMLASGESFQIVQQVAGLASDLRSGNADLTLTATVPPVTDITPSPLDATTSPITPTQARATVKRTATAIEPTPTEPEATMAFSTPTAPPAPSLTPTASEPFQLVSQEQICNSNLTNGLMQVSVTDKRRHQMAGVDIHIAWTGGEETFFTGLKPEIADGYADYIMQAGVVYAVRVGPTGEAVTNLTAPACPQSNGQTYLGGLKLVFQQP